jgi:hypothetical protein
VKPPTTNYRKGDRRRFYDEANMRLLKPLKLEDTIPQDGLRLKGVVQGYAGPNNPFGGRGGRRYMRSRSETATARTFKVVL